MGFRRTALGIMHSLKSKRKPGETSIFAGEIPPPLEKPSEPGIAPSRLIVGGLIAGFKASGMTEDELSGRLGWSPDDVADFHASDDADISLRDLVAYTSALRVVVDIKFQAASDDPASIAAVEGINAAVQGRGS